MVRRRRRRSRDPGEANLDVALLSPLATRVVESGMVDLTAIAGSGEGGQITEEDILAAAGPLDESFLEEAAETERPRRDGRSETSGSVESVFQVETTSPPVILMSPWLGNPLSMPEADLGDPYGPPSPPTNAGPPEEDVISEEAAAPEENAVPDESVVPEDAVDTEDAEADDRQNEPSAGSQNGEMPVSTQEKLEETIASIREAIPDLNGVMVASKEGFPIAHDFAAEESDRLAAMAATALGLGRRVTETAGLGGFDEAVVWGSEGCLVVLAAGAEGVLALSVPSGANLGLVRIEARNAVGIVAGLL